MLTRGRGEERGWDVDERERRREETGWRRGEENFIPIDKDIFNPLSMFHCRTHTWDSDEKERRQDGDEREMGWLREETGW